MVSALAVSPDLSSRFVLPRFLKDLPYNQICPPERCPGRTNLSSRFVLPICPPDLSSRFVLPISAPGLNLKKLLFGSLAGIIRRMDSVESFRRRSKLQLHHGPFGISHKTCRVPEVIASLCVHKLCCVTAFVGVREPLAKLDAAEGCTSKQSGAVWRFNLSRCLLKSQVLSPIVAA